MVDAYAIIIYSSPEDVVFVAEGRKLADCMALGKTHEAALRNLRGA